MGQVGTLILGIFSSSFDLLIFEDTCQFFKATSRKSRTLKKTHSIFFLVESGVTVFHCSLSAKLFCHPVPLDIKLIALPVIPPPESSKNSKHRINISIAGVASVFSAGNLVP